MKVIVFKQESEMGPHYYEECCVEGKVHFSSHRWYPGGYGRNNLKYKYYNFRPCDGSCMKEIPTVDGLSDLIKEVIETGQRHDKRLEGGS